MVKPLEYKQNLSIEEARAYLQEVTTAARAVMDKYGLDIAPGTAMETGDVKELSDCVGGLLPLGQQRSVMEELTASDDPSSTVFQKTSDLSATLMTYLAMFEGTGVEFAGYMPID